MNKIYANIKLNSFVSQALFILNISFRFLLTPLIITTYSDEITGLYFLVFNISSYFMFFDFGFGRTLTYELIENNNIKRKEELFDASILLYIFLLILFFVVYSLISLTTSLKEFDFINNLSLNIIIISSIFNIGCLLLLQSYNSLLESQGLQFKLNFFKSFSNIIAATSLIILVYNEFEIYYLFLCQALISFACLILVDIYVRVKFSYNFSLKNFKKKLNSILYLIKKGWKIMLNNFFATIYTLTDITLIPIYFGINLVTIYSVSSTTSRYVHSFSSTILNPIHTLYSKALTFKNYNHKLFKNLENLSFLITFSLGLMLFVFSDFLITIWISEEFATQTDFIFKALIFSWIFHAFAIPYFQFLEAKRKEIKNFYGTIILSVVTIIGLFLGVIYSKLELFAISRIGASILFNIFLFYSYSRYNKGSVTKHVLKLILVTVLILFIYYIKNYLETSFDKYLLNIISIFILGIILVFILLRSYKQFSQSLKI